MLACAAGLVALMSACAVDTSNGFPGSGGSGSLGSGCTCPGQTADCDGTQGQCQAGLDCRRTDNGNNICTRDCGSNPITGACPANFICKALSVPGTRLACVVAP